MMNRIRLGKVETMVKEVQLIDEYYDDEDDEDLLFVPPSYYDSDEQLAIFACLLLLKQLFERLESMTPQDIVDEVDGILDDFESELVQTATSQIDSTVYDSFRNELIEWNIPVFGGYVKQDVSMYPILRSSIKGLVDQLRNDLKTKSQFFIDNLSKNDFDASTFITH